MEGRLTLDELTALVDRGEVDTVLVALVGLDGDLKGRRLHARHFLNGGYREQSCSASLLEGRFAADGARDRHGVRADRDASDLTMRPDLSTLRLAPWLPGTALVLSDALDALGHAAVPQSPRQILKRQIGQVKELGFDVIAATEMEFHLFESGAPGSGGQVSPRAQARAGDGRAHDLRLGSGSETVMRRLRAELTVAGLPVEGSGAGAGQGQQCLTLGRGPALEAAQNHVIARQAVREIAAQEGGFASFLARYHPHAAGSAARIQLSLWQGREPAFLDTSMPHGMSRLMRAFVGGLIRGADDCALFYAPHINSYKRFRPGVGAPAHKAWSIDDHGAGFRLCGEGTGAIRIECRLPGTDANPCLAIAAFLAAGLDGIAQHLDCGEPVAGRAELGTGVRVPNTLVDARLALHGSMMLRAAMGDAVVDHHVRAAEREQRAFDAAVTDWELAQDIDAV